MLDLVGRDAIEVSAQLVADPTRIVSIIDAVTVRQLGGRYVFVKPNRWHSYRRRQRPTLTSQTSTSR